MKAKINVNCNNLGIDVIIMTKSVLFRYAFSKSLTKNILR